MLSLNDNDIEYISNNLPMIYYHNNILATRELVDLLNKHVKKDVLCCPADYIKAYEDICFTYKTFEEFVESELEQGVYGFTEKECKDAVNKIIFQLPCGLWVQFI